MTTFIMVVLTAYMHCKIEAQVQFPNRVFAILITGETGEFEAKKKEDRQNYYYDTWDKVWKKEDQPYGPGKANRYPQDYGITFKTSNTIQYFQCSLMHQQLLPTTNSLFSKIST